jgi:hypothetical protein
MGGFELARPDEDRGNLRDCVSHLERSSSGTDFAYTVLLPGRDEVIGCVYFKSTRPARFGAVDVRSWLAPSTPISTSPFTRP